MEITTCTATLKTSSKEKFVGQPYPRLQEKTDPQRSTTITKANDLLDAFRIFISLSRFKLMVMKRKSLRDYFTDGILMYISLEFCPKK